MIWIRGFFLKHFYFNPPALQKEQIMVQEMIFGFECKKASLTIFRIYLFAAAVDILIRIEHCC